MPCGEDWEKMVPAERGRHCEQCCKTVVDFTGMSDGEVLRFFKDRALGGAGVGHEHGGVCGRFAADQLQRELAPAPVQRNGFKGWYLVLASALMVAGRQEGRSPLKPKVEERRGLPGGLPDTVRQDVIVGEVAGPTKEARIGFSVPRIVRDTPIKTVTQGTPVLRTMGKVFHGGDTMAVKVDTMPEVVVTAKPPITNKHLTGITALIGDTVLYTKRRPDSASRIDTVISMIKDSLTAVLPGVFAADDLVKVYPNPVLRGGTMRLQWGGSGKYVAALLDLHGQTQQEREWVVAGKGQIDEWEVPVGLAPGVYFLRVMRPGEKAVTKEVVIQ